MAYTIPPSCIHCGVCLPNCPTGAIQRDENHEYWVEPGLCDNCKEQDALAPCVRSCPDSLPLLLPSKKGRYRAEARSLNAVHLFANGQNNPFASSMVIWEACNVLAKGAVIPWQTDRQGKLYFERQVKQGEGKIEFRLSGEVKSKITQTLSPQDARATMEAMDIRAACLHLIFAAYVTTRERPWEQEFAFDSQQIETYLGLDKRKDLSKAVKLTLIKKLVQQPCQLIAKIDWFRQGKIPSFSVAEDRIWHLVAIENHFQADPHGYKHLVGMSFRIRAGKWAEYFLNKQGYKKYEAYYQYGMLPKFLLTTVMTIWHQHEGAVRMMLWLLFKTKMGKQQRMTVLKLMYVAYGESQVKALASIREKRKRLSQRFESDLEVLNHYQIKAIFDPMTYPVAIQPLWARLAVESADPAEAMELGIKDGGQQRSLNTPAVREKWNLLLKARILDFELPPEWEQQLSCWEKKKQRKKRSQNQVQDSPALSAEQIASARQRLGISQRKLAQQLGKSQSWIRDLENGRLAAKPGDRRQLEQILEIVK